MKDGDYPQKVSVLGEEYILKSESRWLRRFTASDGRFYIVSRLRDGSFDESLCETLKVDSLSKREKEEAALAIKISGRKDLPAPWLQLVAETKIFTF